MSPLQKIAMGLVIIIGRAPFPANPTPKWEWYDALPDPIGWLLVIAGTFALARTNDAFTSRWLAVIAAAVSVPMWFPQVNHSLDASGGWFASLPQIVFCLFLAREIGIEAARQSPPDAYVAKRFGMLVWAFGLVAVLPVLAIGGDIQQLVEPTALVSWIVNVAFVYFLFRVHRREWLGGPGPLEVQPRKDPRKDSREGGGKREGRPPSS